MRRVFLIRHGHPDFPFGAHMCLGRTDTPLGPLGRMQAALLGEELGGRELKIFSSPLTRCMQTASPIGEAVPVPALAEQDMGPWDGLDFDTIRREWPELYDRRQDEPLLVPPGAETLAAVQARILPALDAILAESEGDLAVVAHASVIQAILAALTGTPLERSRALRPPYGSYTLLTGDGALRVENEAQLPRVALTPTLAEKLLTAAAPGERVMAHSRAVAAEALRVAQALPTEPDTALLESAALLHDVARAERDHAALGAAWLRALGYEKAAAIVARHHDFDGGAVDEAAILYIADKCVREDARVTLAERFASSAAHCRTEEAREAHAGRLAAALRLKEEINRLCGRCVIE